MSKSRVLIDTNVLIALEDSGQTNPVAAEFAMRCQKGGITIFLHSATLADFQRDSDKHRQSISASRMGKYPNLAEIPLPDPETLTARFGAIRNANDAVDVELLHALSINAVDLLVSQDAGIHKRALGGPLEERVLTIADAVEWLRALQDPIDEGLRQVSDKKAYSISTSDPIFATLREDYQPFDEWWRRKCVAGHRDCWIIDGQHSLDGLVVRKLEGGDFIGLPPSADVLKLCTFKVAAHARGHRVGELLLRKALWHAQLNNLSAIYLTAFAKHEMLINLLERYGFTKKCELPNTEGVYVKLISGDGLEPPTLPTSIEQVRANYPRFAISHETCLFAIPVQWAFHRQLFPEIARLAALPLFKDTTFDRRAWRHAAGNTIRKVYVCHSRNSMLKTGDLLFFYQSKDRAAHHSQAFTSVGIVEQTRRAKDSQELIRLTAGRSVFSETALDQLCASATMGVMVIDFLLVGHLEPFLPLEQLVDGGVLNAPPQTITKLQVEGLKILRRSMNFGFAF
jgi:GNAT superfamily N-acetyltransferase